MFKVKIEARLGWTAKAHKQVKSKVKVVVGVYAKLSDYIEQDTQHEVDQAVLPTHPEVRVQRRQVHYNQFRGFKVKLDMDKGQRP